MSDTVLKLRDSRGKLLIPGVCFESNRLIINEDLEGEQLRELLKFLLAAESASIWWFADLLVWLKEKYGERGEAIAIETAGQSENPERLLDAMRIAQNFKAARFGVSYMHHREAFVELGQDANAAVEWLKQAESNHWTVSQLRREIRQSQRSVNKEATSSGSVTLTGVLALLRAKLRVILEQHPLNEWSEEEIAGIRMDLEPIAQLIGDVESKWQELSA
jgi:hypothetical protein